VAVVGVSGSGKTSMAIGTLYAEGMHRFLEGLSTYNIDHDLDLIGAADHLIDMGPGGGPDGGHIVAAGTPEEVARNPDSVTGPGYAAGESDRAGLGLRFVTLLPQLTPATALGTAGVAGYAARQGVDPGRYAENLQPVLTPVQVGQAVLELATDPASGPEYLINGSGLRPVG
jgi:hypothetical protein